MGFRCVMLDRPGCGLSDPLTTGFDDVERLGAFAETMIVDLLDAMGVHEAHVVATSFGGYVALRTAAAHPDRICRVVELGWTVGAPIARVPVIMRIAGVPLSGACSPRCRPTNARCVRCFATSASARPSRRAESPKR